MSEPTNHKREPSVRMSLVVFLCAMGIMLFGLVIFELDIHIVMLLALAFACIVSAPLGYSFDDLVECMKKTLGQSMSAMIIFIFIGLIIAAWIFSGTVPALIYYGLMLLILLLTFVVLGYREVSNILFLSFLYPLVLWVLNHWTVEIILSEKLIAVMFFGVIYGVGAGITCRLGYSYGGTDTLAKILKTRVLKATELKNILLALDGLIMLVMLFAFRLDVVAYALVGQIIDVNSMNYVIFNLGPKLYEIQIICENSRAIESFIIHEIKKSATLSQVTGSYSGQTKTQVDCVCNSREYVQLREFIRDQGVDCFIKVFPLTHVFGQNKDFHRLSDENL